MLQDNQQVEQNQPESQPTQAEQQPAAPVQPEPPKQPEKPSKPAAVPVKSSQEEKMWAAIGYIAFLGVVTLAMQPKSEFCRKHASQGLVIFAVWFVALIVMAGPSFIGAIGGLVMLASTVLAVLGIVKSLQSYEFNVPILTDIAKNVPVNAIIGSMTGKSAEPTTPEEQSQDDQQPPQDTPQN